MGADVQGKDVHYTERITPPGGSATTKEAYLISSQEYEVVNGKVGPAGEHELYLEWCVTGGKGYIRYRFFTVILSSI